jgi:hypothetical protein
MAKEEKPKQAKEAKGFKAKKRLSISALGIVDNMVFSKSDRWAYYRISNEIYDFLSTDRKVALGAQITNAFATLMTDRQTSLEGQIIVTSVPVDVDSWSAQVNGVSEDWDRPDGYYRYMEEQIEYLKTKEYLKKATYLGINIGKRGALDMGDLNIFESGIKGAVDVVKQWWNSALMVPTEAVSAAEENDTRRKEADFFRMLSLSHLNATRVTSEELLLLIKRQFYPQMPAPYLDVDHGNRLGPGDLELEVGSAIENRYRWLKITQMVDGQEISGYRATLSFSKFPKFMEYPNGTIPFLYFPAKLFLPFTTYARFTLHPTAKMKKELEKKQKEKKDELENLTAGQSALDATVTGAPTDVVESMQDMQLMQDMLAQDKAPWLEASYRIVVETPDEEKLRKYCSFIKQRYADLEINVNWTAGDQAELFLEQMPGDRLRVPSFKQLTNLAVISTSGFNFSSDVGDPLFSADGDVRA